MKMNFQSIAISPPQFINLQPTDISPLISKCEIKVMYIDANRNGSFMSEEVTTEMAKTLRGNPIVGYFSEEKQDFTDHGEQVVLGPDGIEFNCLTRPYGFVAPDAKVWFQNFEEVDEQNRKVTRKYLMTTGYLWTGQYPECEVCTTEGRPHSMELDEDTLQGHWAEGDNSSMELFIVTDAIFSKLCILGEDVEPCFEGSEIISPNISQNFTYTQAFKKSLFTIMQEFNKVLQGGNSTMDEQNTAINDTIESTTPDSETQTDMPAAADTLDVFKKTDDKEEKENTDKENKEEKDEEEEKEKKSSKHSLDDITDKFSILQRQYEDLVKQNTELMEFQKATISEKKQGIVDKFTMLSDEEKAPIIAEMENFSIKELEKEFYAVLGKKEFSRLNKIEKEVENNNTVATPTTTFNLDSNADASIPAWIKAIENVHKNNI